MSETVKCKICGYTGDDRCELMRVVIEEDGKEVAYCCEHLYTEKKKGL
ncbi:hypothetical protein JXL21_10145 [Candidatus Bathyarchaeota archaeon]|nr:hypothetical protein [Candidatus Bathyarchaeota archaeon]